MPGASKVCPTCGRVFTKQEHLQRHLRRHNNETPFSCALCGKSFGRKDVLRRHQRSSCRTDVQGSASTSGVAATVLDGANSLAMNDTSVWDAPSFDTETEAALPVDAGVPDDLPFINLDSFLTDMINEWAHGTETPHFGYESAGLPQPSIDPAVLDRDNRARHPGAADTVIETTSRNQDRLVDEQYSSDLTRQLRSTQHCLDSVFSASYLNLCLELYFSRFHPVFPIVHKATFYPQSQNTLLLASMCSIGSLLIGSQEAVAHAQQLYSRLNKAILASWETHLSGKKPTTLPMVQAALLGQTFGMLSGRPADRFMTEVFHGTLLVWARKIGAFDSFSARRQSSLVDSSDAARQPLSEGKWANWVRKEERCRLALALYVHEAETASLAGRESFLRHELITHGANCCDDMSFNAPTLAKWARHTPKITGGVTAQSIRDWLADNASQQDITTSTEDCLSFCISTSSMSAYGVLSSLECCILDEKAFEPLTSARIESFATALQRWYVAYRTYLNDSEQSDKLCLMVLWHHIWACLYIDNTVVDEMLKESPANTSTSLDGNDSPFGWNMASNITLALMHACLGQKRARDLTLGAVPPVHLARVIYKAGQLLVLYTRGCRNESTDRKRDRTSKTKVALRQATGQETISLAENRPWMDVMDWAVDIIAHQTLVQALGCVDLLQKLCAWGVAADFADQLRKLTQAEM